MTRIEAIQCDGCGTLIAANKARNRRGPDHWMLDTAEYTTPERKRLDTADVCNDCIGRWYLDDRAIATEHSLDRPDWSNQG